MVRCACDLKSTVEAAVIPLPAVLLAQLLPTSSVYTRQRLEAVQQELDELEGQQQAIGRRARRRQAALVWGGLASQVRAGSGALLSSARTGASSLARAGVPPTRSYLAPRPCLTAPPAHPCPTNRQSALWLLLFRLTFWELSWDVMEPICFFVGGGQVMVSCWCQPMCLGGSTWRPLALAPRGTLAHCAPVPTATICRPLLP